MTTAREHATNFHWLLDNFVDETANVIEAVAVSSDGLLLGASGGDHSTNAEQLGALIAAVAGLGDGVSGFLKFEQNERVIFEMSLGYFLVSPISDTSIIGVVAEQRADLGVVGYETAVLVERIGRVLTPAVIAELQNLLVL